MSPLTVPTVSGADRPDCSSSEWTSPTSACDACGKDEDDPAPWLIFCLNLRAGLPSGLLLLELLDEATYTARSCSLRRRHHLPRLCNSRPRALCEAVSANLLNFYFLLIDFGNKSPSR